jgi:hypothetical protein
MEDYIPIRVPAGVDSTKCTHVFGFFHLGLVTGSQAHKY